MKIRVTGTMDEVRQAQEFYRHLGQQENVRYCSVSEPYANRNSVNQYRVYVDIVYETEIDIFGSMLPSEKE